MNHDFIVVTNSILIGVDFKWICFENIHLKPITESVFVRVGPVRISVELSTTYIVGLVQLISIT